MRVWKIPFSICPFSSKICFTFYWNLSIGSVHCDGSICYFCALFAKHTVSAMCVCVCNVYLYICVQTSAIYAQQTVCMWWRPIVAQGRRAKALSCAKGEGRREMRQKRVNFSPFDIFAIALPSFLHDFSIDISNLEFAPKLSLYSYLAKLGSPTSSRKNHAATLPPSSPSPHLAPP